MRARVTLVLVLLAGIAGGISPLCGAAEVALVVGVATGSPGGTARVEVTMSDAAEVGALDLELGFDPAVARFVAVEPGPVARGALIEANEIEPGRLLIALVAGDGLAAEGRLLRTDFEIAGAEGDRTEVRVEAANAYHHEQLINLPLVTTDGEIAVVASGTPAIGDAEASGAVEDLPQLRP
jgi:hypothetical protein